MLIKQVKLKSMDYNLLQKKVCPLSFSHIKGVNPDQHGYKVTFKYIFSSDDLKIWTKDEWMQRRLNIKSWSLWGRWLCFQALAT